MSIVTFENGSLFSSWRFTELILVQFSIAIPPSWAVSRHLPFRISLVGFHEGHATLITGHLLSELRFNAAGFGWKSYQSEENNPMTYSGGDVRGATWLR